jgi:hypothetical protein
MDFKNSGKCAGAEICYENADGVATFSPSPPGAFGHSENLARLAPKDDDRPHNLFLSPLSYSSFDFAGTESMNSADKAALRAYAVQVRFSKEFFHFFTIERIPPIFFYRKAMKRSKNPQAAFLETVLARLAGSNLS